MAICSGVIVVVFVPYPCLGMDLKFGFDFRHLIPDGIDRVSDPDITGVIPVNLLATRQTNLNLVAVAVVSKGHIRKVGHHQ
jgi:hypothetical protein